MYQSVCMAMASLSTAFVACQRQPAVDDVPVAVIDSISLDEVRAIADSVGIAELFKRVSQPSTVMTDFFGVQPLRPYTLDDIVTDLVPDHATVVTRGTNRATLRLRGGPAVIVQADGRLFINGNEVETPYARIILEQPSAYPRETALFRAALIEAGLGDRYLPSNPYHELELRVAEVSGDSSSAETTIVSADTSGFNDHGHAVLLVGETHGGTHRYEQALKLLSLASISWIAIEMVPENLQPSLDAFQSQPPGSSSHEAARHALLTFFSNNWNTRGHEVTEAPEDNPYFRMIVAARRLGKRVIGLDTRSDYILFRFGEFPLGATVRDATWAARIPREGRGIVYGGSSHFSPGRIPNMLTFLRSRDRSVRIFELRLEN
jgi:hypothetical protein